jgi:DNA-directed RNA polymerase subunit E'
MFYELEIKGHIRIDPKFFSENLDEALLKSLNEKFDSYISKELGAVIAVKEIVNIGDGIIIPGDGAAYYDTTFRILTFKPEMQEVVLGRISDITDFGAFIEIGPIDGMIHISQTMDDYVSFSKSNVLTGKESKKVLKVNDKCRARIIAISYKEISNPKIGLTMRQHRLGNLNWIEEDLKKESKSLKQKSKEK